MGLKNKTLGELEVFLMRNHSHSWTQPLCTSSSTSIVSSYTSINFSISKLNPMSLVFLSVFFVRNPYAFALAF